MDENCQIPSPVNFNCWKHHASFIRTQIHSVNSSKDIDLIQKFLLKIGESQMDLYYGSLSPSEIARGVNEILRKENIFLLSHYTEWLKRDSRDYRLVKLEDKSTWTLRLGENPERYVHIHPGRYSAYTLRVKATSMKTVIFILCLEHLGELKFVDTETVNQIRKKYLDEPPLKSLSKASGLIRLLDLFRNKI